MEYQCQVAEVTRAGFHRHLQQGRELGELQQYTEVRTVTIML